MLAGNSVVIFWQSTHVLTKNKIFHSTLEIGKWVHYTIRLFLDDDQGESYILTAVIDARKAYVWKITIMEKTNETRLRDGATKIHLLLRQGDGYSMDGE